MQGFGIGKELRVAISLTATLNPLARIAADKPSSKVDVELQVGIGSEKN